MTAAAQVAQATLLRQAQRIRGGSPLSEEDESPGTGTASSNAQSYEETASRQIKRRKPYHHLRKEERRLLANEVEQLQTKMRELETAQYVSARIALDQSLALNALLSTDVEEHNLSLAGAQSMISAEMASRFRNPLEHYIYLPADRQLREHSLRTLKQLKLDTATRLVRERMRYLDIGQLHKHSECSVLPNGDFLISQLDVTPFDGCTDVRFVFDEFTNFLASLEAATSDQLGVLAVRESECCVESSARQCRISMSIVPGLDIETNIARFTRFVTSPDGVTPSYGIGAVDFVDKDDLYPYQSTTRLREDITACTYITQTFPDPSLGGQSGPTGSTMVRCATIRVHRSQFPASKQMERLARASAESWLEVMPRVLLQRLGLH